MTSPGSPLQQIEREVQLRATRSAIDVDTPQGAEDLRRLIADVVADRIDEHRRGSRPVALADPDGVSDRAFRNLARYGPLTELLEDDDVWEIMVNAPDEIFVRRHSAGSRFHHEVFHDDDHVARTLTKLLEDSTTSHRKLDPTEGLQDAQLDDGARLHIVHGDLSRGNHLMVNIRKFTGVAISSLDELVARGTISPAASRFLTAAVRARLSIVFAGAPGAGKTTLLLLRSGLDPRSVVSQRRSSRPTSRWRTWRACRRVPPGPTAPRSTCDDWSPASCAWLPTSRSSARSATVRRCRCCSRCRRA
jgi:pilus assembly protein CpaF